MLIHNTNYYLPIRLEMLDYYFTTMKPEEVLAMLREIDPVLQLTSLEQLSIKKVVDEKYIDEKYTEIITDEKVLKFPVEMVLVDGKILIEDFKVCTVDENKTVRDAQESAERIGRKAEKQFGKIWRTPLKTMMDREQL